jgi:hypothetical protein
MLAPLPEQSKVIIMNMSQMSLKKKWVDLQCRGYTNDRIAETTNSDPRWVRHFLQRNNLKALERMAKQRAAERARQVLRLELMIEEAAMAWERSIQAEETIETIEEPVSGQVQVSQSQGATTGYTQVSSPTTLVRTKKTVKYKCGDIAYLKAMQEFMRDIRSILKIDDGTKRIDLSLNVPSGNDIKATLNLKDVAAAQLNEWNMEQKERLQKLLEMPPPEINTDPDRPLSSDDNGNGNGNRP